MAWIPVWFFFAVTLMLLVIARKDANSDYDGAYIPGHVALQCMMCEHIVYTCPCGSLRPRNMRFMICKKCGSTLRGTPKERQAN